MGETHVAHPNIPVSSNSILEDMSTKSPIGLFKYYSNSERNLLSIFTIITKINIV